MPTTSARLLALLSLLQTRRDWPGALLAERLGVSLRTVRRDVDRLRELGYPIVAGKGPAAGGYRLTLGSWSWPSLAAAVARFDADIEVVSPAELGRAFARLADRFAAAAG